MILESLLQSYKRNIYQWIKSQELRNITQIDDPCYLLAVVVYLQHKELVDLKKFVGSDFHIRLSTSGFQSLQNHTKDNAMVMVGAYKILFTLANRFRQFIESTIRSKRGAEWWNKWVSDRIRRAKFRLAGERNR